MNKQSYSMIGIFILFILLIPLANLSLSFDLKRQFRNNSDYNVKSNFSEFSNENEITVSKISDNILREPFGKFFFENKGQCNEQFNYYTGFSGIIIGFTTSRIYFIADNNQFFIEFIGANKVDPKGSKNQEGFSNYYFGDVSYTNIRHYNQIVYENLYDGINLVYKFTTSGLKYDFIVEPFADIEQITIKYTGLDNLELTPQSLRLEIGNTIISDDNLIAWYEGTKEPVKVQFNYMKNSENKTLVNFSIKEFYDNSQRIIIDPLICTFSTYVGGSFTEHVLSGSDVCEKDIAVDKDGYIYYAGQTASSDFPLLNAYQNIFAGASDAVLLKMTPTGQLIFATLIGGTSHDVGKCVAVDNSGNIVLLGVAYSTDFPLLNAFQDTHGGSEEKKDTFITKFNSTGGLLFSTYFGGSDHDYPNGVSLDDYGNIIYCGSSSSSDFYTKNAYQSELTLGGEGADITITKFTADGQSIIFSTFFGGLSSDMGMDIVLDSQGNIILTGQIAGTEFPTLHPLQTTVNGGFSSFIAKFSPSGSLEFATTIDGATYEIGLGVTVDFDDNIIITGGTTSIDFPLINATQSTFGGSEDIFILKLSSNGQELLYSSYFGGQGGDEGQDVKIDNEGNIVVVGMTASPDFPIQHAYQDTYSGSNDACIIIIAQNGTLISSSFIGGSKQDKAIGIAIDSENNLIVGGWTYSSNFPTENAYQSNLKGENDFFITKLYLDLDFTATSATVGTIFALPTIFVIISLLGGCIIKRKKKSKVC